MASDVAIFPEFQFQTGTRTRPPRRRCGRPRRAHSRKGSRRGCAGSVGLDLGGRSRARSLAARTRGWSRRHAPDVGERRRLGCPGHVEATCPPDARPTWRAGPGDHRPGLRVGHRERERSASTSTRGNSGGRASRARPGAGPAGPGRRLASTMRRGKSTRRWSWATSSKRRRSRRTTSCRTSAASSAASLAAARRRRSLAASAEPFQRHRDPERPFGLPERPVGGPALSSGHFQPSIGDLPDGVDPRASGRGSRGGLPEAGIPVQLRHHLLPSQGWRGFECSRFGTHDGPDRRDDEMQFHGAASHEPAPGRGTHAGRGFETDQGRSAPVNGACDVKSRSQAMGGRNGRSGARGAA